MASPTRSSNHRASLAVLLGLAGLLAIPGAIYLSKRSGTIGLIDAAWAIPVAVALAVTGLLFARGARGRIVSTLERAGGRGRIRLGRFLAVTGICVALSSSIAVGFYELLLRLEG
jgi:steroid 5-alpha reductase family enzyme